MLNLDISPIIWFCEFHFRNNYLAINKVSLPPNIVHFLCKPHFPLNYNKPLQTNLILRFVNLLRFRAVIVVSLCFEYFYKTSLLKRWQCLYVHKIVWGNSAYNLKLSQQCTLYPMFSSKRHFLASAAAIGSN